MCPVNENRHHSGACTVYNTATKRKQRLRQLQRCIRCGRPDDSTHGPDCLIHKPCEAHPNDSAPHVGWLCEGHSTRPSQSGNPQAWQKASIHQYRMGIEQMTFSLSPMIIVPLTGLDGQGVIKVKTLFDSGSGSDWIARPLLNLLKFNPRGRQGYWFMLLVGVKCRLYNV